MSGAIREAWTELRNNYYQNHPEIGVVVNQTSSPALSHVTQPVTGAIAATLVTQLTNDDDEDDVVGTIDNLELLRYLDTLEDGEKFKQEVKRVAMEWYWRGFYHGFAEGKQLA